MTCKALAVILNIRRLVEKLSIFVLFFTMFSSAISFLRTLLTLNVPNPRDQAEVVVHKYSSK